MGFDVGHAVALIFSGPIACIFCLVVGAAVGFGVGVGYGRL